MSTNIYIADAKTTRNIVRNKIFGGYRKFEVINTKKRFPSFQTDFRKHSFFAIHKTLKMEYRRLCNSFFWIESTVCFSANIICMQWSGTYQPTQDGVYLVLFLTFSQTITFRLKSSSNISCPKPTHHKWNAKLVEGLRFHLFLIYLMEIAIGNFEKLN